MPRCCAAGHTGGYSCSGTAGVPGRQGSRIRQLESLAVPREHIVPPHCGADSVSEEQLVQMAHAVLRVAKLKVGNAVILRRQS